MLPRKGLLREAHAAASTGHLAGQAPVYRAWTSPSCDRHPPRRRPSAHREYDRAERLLDEALDIAQDLRVRGYALTNLAEIALRTGDVGRACELHELGLRSVEDAGDEWGVLFCLYNLGMSYLYGDDLNTGAGYLRRGLARADALGDRSLISDFLAGLATVRSRAGRPELGARLGGAVAALRAFTGAAPHDVVLHEAAAEQARADLGHARFEAEWARGQAWELSDAIAAGLTVV